MKDYKKIKMFLVVSLFSFTATLWAYPGNRDVVPASSEAFGTWLAHQVFNIDYLLTVLMLALVLALTGGRALFRRRRSRRQLISG
jgi:hypothetical protein